MQNVSFGLITAIELMDRLEHIPSESDYEESMFGISRLHQVYKKEADFTKPTAENHADFLTGTSYL